MIKELLKNFLTGALVIGTIFGVVYAIIHFSLAKTILITIGSLGMLGAILLTGAGIRKEIDDYKVKKQVRKNLGMEK